MLKIHNWLPNLLELTDWSEIFTEVTVHQDKFFGLSNFEKILKYFRKFEIEISKIDNFGLDRPMQQSSMTLSFTAL
jgi:hypothetical protein